MTVNNEQIYGRDALKNGEPWIVPEALSLLKTFVKPDWRVFEWGSGGSTVFWSRNCKGVIAIEHLDNWIERTKQMLIDFNCPNNWTLHYAPADMTVTQEHYRNYANAILQYDTQYDLIYIDGEATSRKWCLEHALTRVKKGGYLLLDNSNWLADYDFGTDWQRWDFVERNLHWIGQAETFDWYTSILKRL